MELIKNLTDKQDLSLEEKVQALLLENQALQVEVATLKQSEERLKQAQHQLNTIVGERTAEVLEMNTKLRRELNERKMIQSQLVQAQKMESIGQLAAGVAHEINNPIGFVTSNLGTLASYVAVFKQLLGSYAELMEFYKAEDLNNDKGNLILAIDQAAQQNNLTHILNDVDALLLESQDGTRRVKEIVQNLRNFSRIDHAEVTQVNINDCLEATVKVMESKVKEHGCDVQLHLGQIPPVLCNPGQLNQVFMNILINAIQSISGSGHITVETKLLPDQDQMAIRISDTGCGISNEQLSLIFNPFFTTRPVGSGLGLGLSIAYDIVHKHQGRIDVSSQVGQGSVFTILLPLGDLN